MRAHLLDSLVTAVTDPRCRLRVILTLRADFYDRPLLYPGFSELVRRRTEAVVPLTGEELQRAIVGPAERAGVKVDPDLIAAIRRDIGEQPGTLPLLQYALTELFERRQGCRLTLQIYQSSGGVLGALARRADELFSGFDAAGQAMARQLFLRLVALGEGVEDTRRRVPQSQLVFPSENEQALDNVLDAFGKARLLTFDHDPVTRGPTMEIAHEALIRGWDRLKAWIDESREALRMQHRLAEAAVE